MPVTSISVVYLPVFGDKHSSNTVISTTTKNLHADWKMLTCTLV